MFVYCVFGLNVILVWEKNSYCENIFFFFKLGNRFIMEFIFLFWILRCVGNNQLLLVEVFLLINEFWGYSDLFC